MNSRQNAVEPLLWGQLVAKEAIYIDLHKKILKIRELENTRANVSFWWEGLAEIFYTCVHCAEHFQKLF